MLVSVVAYRRLLFPAKPLAPVPLSTGQIRSVYSLRLVDKSTPGTAGDAQGTRRGRKAQGCHESAWSAHAWSNVPSTADTRLCVSVHDTEAGHMYCCLFMPGLLLLLHC